MSKEHLLNLLCRVYVQEISADEAFDELEDLIDRIKRLEEALDLVRPHCDSVHHSKKHQHQYGEPCPVVALIENAKEAKL